MTRRDPVDAAAEDLDVERARQQRQVERWFVRRGVPHLIEDYNASEDVFTRAWPVLGLVFLIEVAAPVREDVPWWVNGGLVIGGLLAMAGALATVNTLRGRPLGQQPNSIGPVELGLFVLVPGIVPLVVGDADVAAAAVGLNLVVLVVVYAVTSYGLLPMSLWAIGQMQNQFRNVANLLIRSLPLLLVFTMFMFINAELWKVATDIPGDFFASALGLLFGTGFLFLALKIPGELEGVARFEGWDEVADLTVGTPLEARSGPVPDVPVPDPPTGRRPRLNAALVLLIGQGLQVATVTLAIWLFYVVFGILTISPDTIAQWTSDQSPGVVVELTILENDVVLTGALLRVSAFIAAIAGLQLTVQALTDQSYRAEYVEESLLEMRRNFAVRALYLSSLYEPAR